MSTIIDSVSGRTAEMHTAVRSVLKHHQVFCKITNYCYSVVEADLIEAVLKCLRDDEPSTCVECGGDGGTGCGIPNCKY